MMREEVHGYGQKDIRILSGLLRNACKGFMELEPALINELVPKVAS